MFFTDSTIETLLLRRSRLYRKIRNPIIYYESFGLPHNVIKLRLTVQLRRPFRVVTARV